MQRPNWCFCSFGALRSLSLDQRVLRKRLSDCSTRRSTGPRSSLHHFAGSVRQGLFPYIAALLTLVSRILTSGRPYFGYGPASIDAITKHIYAIQPPGYWLFTRLASLFPDPALGIHCINRACSALGVFVFYFVAAHMLTPVVAKLATTLLITILRT